MCGQNADYIFFKFWAMWHKYYCRCAIEGLITTPQQL